MISEKYLHTAGQMGFFLPRQLPRHPSLRMLGVRRRVLPVRVREGASPGSGKRKLVLVLEAQVREGQHSARDDSQL
jgi:hypothetical protein